MDELPISVGMHEYGTLNVRIATQGHTISEVVAAFECALRGAGYCFDGHFELEEE